MAKSLFLEIFKKWIDITARIKLCLNEVTSEVSFSAEVNALGVPLPKISSRWSYQSVRGEGTDVFLYHMPFLTPAVHPDSRRAERLLMASESMPHLYSAPSAREAKRTMFT